MQPTFRSIVQFTAGRYIGLLAQVIDVNGRHLRLFHRDLDGKTNFLDATADDPFVVLGTAVIGPKPKAPDQAPVVEQSPQAPLNPVDLLTPLPSDVKPTPIAGAGDLDSLPTGGESEAVTQAPPAPAPSPLAKLLGDPPGVNLPEPKSNKPRRWLMAVVRNGRGDVATPTIHFRADLDHTKKAVGVMIRAATRTIPNIKPFVVTDWEEVAGP